MKLNFNLFFTLFLLLTISCAISDTVIPESELQSVPPSKILEYAHDKYSDDMYTSAIYYYSNIIKNYTKWNDNDSLAWANYEIGYILYDEERFKEAYPFFENVTAIKSISSAPQILASKMKNEVSQKIGK